MIRRQYEHKKETLQTRRDIFNSCIGIFSINYYVFHFVTDDGLTLTWHEEAGKPFVTDLIGQLGTLLTFGSIASFLVGAVVFKKDEKNCY